MSTILNAKTVARLAIAAGTLTSTVVIGWVIAKGDGNRTAWLALGIGGALLVAGVAYLLALKELYKFVTEEAHGLVAVTAVGLMLAVGARADPGTGALADRVLVWAFVVFCVGLSELFLLFVVAAILGRIDLSQAFVDKSAVEPPAGDIEPQMSSAGKASGTPAGKSPSASVSLSRLQAFAWTLVVMIVYFHRVVTNKSGDLPTIPAELLMVMGISGAVYLTSKEMGARAELEKAKLPPTPPAAPTPNAPPAGPAAGAPVTPQSPPAAANSNPTPPPGAGTSPGPTPP